MKRIKWWERALLSDIVSVAQFMIYDPWHRVSLIDRRDRSLDDVELMLLAILE